MLLPKEAISKGGTQNLRDKGRLAARGILEHKKRQCLETCDRFRFHLYLSGQIFGILDEFPICEVSVFSPLFITPIARLYMSAVT